MLRMDGGRPDEHPLGGALRSCVRCGSIQGGFPIELPMRPSKVPCVYILASERNGTTYVGVTSNLASRMEQHRLGLTPGFTTRYRVHRLVYHELHETMEAAIIREKRLKGWRRLWKLRLIEEMNPEWIDLYDTSSGEILDGPADVERRNE